MLDTIKIANFGPIANLDIKLGDLTILIGPQASGKTLFLQLLKLVVDQEQIVSNLTRYNYVTENNVDNILNCYMGEGLSRLWNTETRVMMNGQEFQRESISNDSYNSPCEKVFYIPAQRILSIADGRPKNFMEFDISTPYVLRQFSETLRLSFQKGMAHDQILFPLREKTSDSINASFNENIFHDGKVIVDERTGQKKMRMEIEGVSLPFMTWSAGQKEFMPLLMAFYCLKDNQKVSSYKYVVIEEPEMGLHPNALQTVLLEVIALMNEGYKVIISTHSSVLLDFAWTNTLLKSLPEAEYMEALKQLLGEIQESLYSNLRKKDIKTYYFSRQDDNHVYTRDISELDVSSDDSAISEWGGISQFSSLASEIVSKYLANNGEE